MNSVISNNLSLTYKKVYTIRLQKYKNLKINNQVTFSFSLQSREAAIKYNTVYKGIPKSLQPDCVKLLHLKLLLLFNLTVYFKIPKVYAIELQRYRD